MNQVPSLLFFFGLAGAGKTFTAQHIASALGYKNYELDDDLTPTMREALAHGRSFTDEMRDEYFTLLKARIGDLKREFPHLILSQAAYKERHRRMIQDAHPELTFVWIQSPDALIFERLLKREAGVSAEYARRIHQNFEPPAATKSLMNDTSDTDVLLTRFQALFP